MSWIIFLMNEIQRSGDLSNSTSLGGILTRIFLMSRSLPFVMLGLHRFERKWGLTISYHSVGRMPHRQSRFVRFPPSQPKISVSDPIMVATKACFPQHGKFQLQHRSWKRMPLRGIKKRIPVEFQNVFQHLD